MNCPMCNLPVEITRHQDDGGHYTVMRCPRCADKPFGPLEIAAAVYGSACPSIPGPPYTPARVAALMDRIRCVPEWADEALPHILDWMRRTHEAIDAFPTRPSVLADLLYGVTFVLGHNLREILLRAPK